MLDAGESSALHHRLLMDGLQTTRTILESDFGLPLADLYFFPSALEALPQHELFVCPMQN